VTAARLSLVVTTTGTRLPEIDRLARSVAASPAADRVELVVVDQSRDRAAVRAVEALAAVEPALRVVVATSGRGASAGRNAGLAVAGGDVVGFPNDNTWYPPAALPTVLDRFDGDLGLDGLAVLVTTADGRPAMLRWPAVSGPVRRATVHRIGITPSLFFRRRLVEGLDGFDERIGTGSNSAAQSGEDSDLVLRALARGAWVEFDRDVVVHNDEPRDALDERFVTKMAGYGVGQGLLWRRHRLPAHLLAALVGRKLVAAPVRAARGQALLARADLAWARGCVTGLLRSGPAGPPGSRP
jgi:glycosyltransferase involved in cell wall biosynthesis